MQLPLNFNKNSNLIINKDLLSYIPEYSSEVKEIITRSHNTEVGEDTLGLSLQKLIDRIERKNSGQFYTPKEVVNYIIEFLKIRPNSTILDPTCGCGVFLATAYKHLKKINQKAINNIYGVDLNKTASELTRINLWIQEKVKTRSLKILEENIRVGNSITENTTINQHAFNWKDQFKKVFRNGGFDFIIGNPPYLTVKKNLDFDESEYSEIIDGPVNAASLIMFKSFFLLKDGGIMAFVLPKTLLRVKSYLKLRNFLLNKSKIIHIVDLGSYFNDVRGEQIILFLKKTNSKNEILKNKILINFFKKSDNLNIKKKEFYLEQELFKKYENFPIFENNILYSIIEKISKSGRKLDYYASIFRGLNLSPHSPFVRKIMTNDLKPIIKGKDISRLDYKTNYFTNYGKNIIKKFKEEKIILQNIFSSESGLIAAKDSKGYISFDTVTNIVLNDRKIDIDYLLALLNSKLINFFLICFLFNKSKLTMHIDKFYIGKLPIVIPSKKELIWIKRTIGKLKISNITALQAELDKKIYSIYKISESEQRVIDTELRSIMSPNCPYLYETKG